MSIVAILIVSLGGGYMSLQRSINLDNAIRALKSDIEKTQNSARNSFLVTDLEKVSLGWMVEFVNENTSVKNLKNIRRSIYVDNTARNFDTPNLRAYVQTLYGKINDLEGFSCIGDNLYYGSNQVYLKPPNEFPVKCSSNLSSDGNEDYYEDVIAKNMNVINSVPDPSIPVCAQKSFFFTSGYSEIATNKTGITGNSCQIVIQTTDNSIMPPDTRAINVDLQNGNISICGNYCL